MNYINFDRPKIKKELPVRVGLLSKEIQLNDWPEIYRIDVKYRGQVVGSVKIEEIPDAENKTFFIYNLKIEKKFQRDDPLNKKPEEFFGFGSFLIEEVKSFLTKRNACGFLIEDMEKKGTNGMYERHGFVPKESVLIKTSYNKTPMFYDGREKNKKNLTSVV